MRGRGATIGAALLGSLLSGIYWIALLSFFDSLIARAPYARGGIIVACSALVAGVLVYAAAVRAWQGRRGR